MHLKPIGVIKALLKLITNGKFTEIEVPASITHLTIFFLSKMSVYQCLLLTDANRCVCPTSHKSVAIEQLLAMHDERIVGKLFSLAPRKVVRLPNQLSELVCFLENLLERHVSRVAASVFLVSVQLQSKAHGLI